MPTYSYPVYNPQVTSGYGPRSRPVAGASTNHKGIDFDGKTGDPVYATSDQTINRAYERGGFGNYIKAPDGSGQTHYYGHLSGYAVPDGARVKQGDLIGYVGNTGASSGSHLHYGVKDAKGNWLNPNRILGKAQNYVDKAKAIVDSKAFRTGAAVATAGASEAVFAATDALGVTGDCSIICQFRKWLEDTQFFQRSAIIILAFILIVAAFALFGKGQTTSVLSKVVKG